MTHSSPGRVLQSLVEFLARLHVGQRRLHVPRRPKIREEPRDGAHRGAHRRRGVNYCVVAESLEVGDGDDVSRPELGHVGEQEQVLADRADVRGRREGARRSGGGSLVGVRPDAGQRGQPSPPVRCFERGPEDSSLYPRHTSLFAPGRAADGLEGICRE